LSCNLAYMIAQCTPTSDNKDCTLRVKQERPAWNTTKTTMSIVVCGAKPKRGQKKRKLKGKENTKTRRRMRKSTGNSS
jgi:hypothetical protein